MRWMLLLLAVASFNLFAQVPERFKNLRVQTYEESREKDDSTMVVHFVTNRFLQPIQEGEEQWKKLKTDKFYLRATQIPLAGTVIVKHDGSPDKENDSNLTPYSIAEFIPHYKVRVVKDDTVGPPFIRNDMTDDGMSFLDSLWKRDVLIYVHGFNNDWPTAIKRAAQIKRDFKKLYKRDFAIVVYSWPSLGGKLEGLLNYFDDEDLYEKSLPAVAIFLKRILMKDGTTVGRGKRWVIAHSMGNRVFLHGFAELGAQHDRAKIAMPRDLFTRIVLAAPDMEVKDFETQTNYAFYFCATKKPVMYFHATSNVAVNTSEGIHWNDRAGVKPVITDKLLTVDAKAAKSPLSELGHGYYASNDKMLKLTADYFFNDADPTKRPDIETIDGGTRFRIK